MVTSSSSAGAGLSRGERYQPFGDHLQDPYPFYAAMRRDEPVTFSPSLDAWVVTRYADIREVLRDPATFSSRNALRPVAPFHPATIAELQQGFPLGPSIPSSDDALHRRLRDPVTRALTPDKVRALVPFIRDRADALVDNFVDEGRADLVEQFALRLPVEVLAKLMDLDPADWPDVTRQSYATVTMTSAPLPEPEQAAAAREYVTFQHLLMRYIEARRKEPREDLISQVVTALTPGTEPLTFEQQTELVAVLSTVTFAGHTTTASQLGTGLHHLLTDRSRWELLRDHPSQLPDAIEEMTRFDPAVQGFFRVTTRPATVGGVELPADAEVLVLYGSGNRDEALTERPDELDLRRGPTQHLAFGFGLHACVGARLARTQLRVALETLTQRLPGLRLAEDGAGATMDIRPGLLHRGPLALHVEW